MRQPSTGREKPLARGALHFTSAYRAALFNLLFLKTKLKQIATGSIIHTIDLTVAQ